LGSGPHLTRSGIGMGTPDYMSPEQAQGMPGDGRGDLYSLGVTLYEMVTGRLPFQADSLMGVVVKHITEPPPPPRQLNPNLPKALEDAILTALAKARRTAFSDRRSDGGGGRPAWPGRRATPRRILTWQPSVSRVRLADIASPSPSARYGLSPGRALNGGNDPGVSS
jgi:serine/threonine protein kinase